MHQRVGEGVGIFREIEAGGIEPVELSPGHDLEVLVREAGRTVPRDEIMAAIWGPDWFGSSRTLDVHISALRRKLGDDPNQPRLVTTVRGVGFRFEP